MCVDRFKAKSRDEKKNCEDSKKENGLLGHVVTSLWALTKDRKELGVKEMILDIGYKSVQYASFKWLVCLIFVQLCVWYGFYANVQ